MRKRQLIIQKAMQEIEKMLYEMEKDGKDLSLIKLKKYQKTHHIDCLCSKCQKANKKKNPSYRGLREYGFKVFVDENDEEILHQ
jgi:hypothetical protein